MQTLSIIVPVYNVEKYLHRCLDSILSQSFRDYELILVDDGSSDQSGKICDEYAARDERIRAFHQLNSGVSSARNLGLDYAKGEWIYFVDADDEVLPGGIDSMLAATNGSESVLASFESCNRKGERLYQTTIGKDVIMSKEDSIRALYGESKTLMGMWGWLWVRLFRNDIIKKYNLRFDTNISYNEDGLFIAEYICRINTPIYYVDSLVYRYYETDTSVMESTKRYFNPKVLTSFASFVRMYQCIANDKESDPELIRVAKDGIINRYIMIRGQMEQHNAIDNNVLREFRHQYIHECGFWFVVGFHIRRTCRRTKNFIKRKLKI
jgi:glycosyltransferase involved in cell wall biosynthesis